MLRRVQGVCVLCLLAGLVCCSAPSGPTGTGAEPGAKARRLTRGTLDESLAAGRGFLLRWQRPEGRFFYEYDFIARTDSQSDNSVRQAGALWGLALMHADRPTPETAAAVRRGLAFFDGISHRSEEGGSYIMYPGEKSGSTGTVALVGLALVEMIRVERDAVRRDLMRAKVNEYIQFLLTLRRGWGFAGRFGRRGPGPVLVPYSDGEALLLLCKAARYTGREDLKPLALQLAEGMYQIYVREALRNDRDSDLTKGFYQWGTMAWFELCDADWPDADVYAERAVRLAYWMIDDHRTLARKRNTAYAQEGLICAWELARRSGNAAAQAKIGNVIDKGLAKLTSWQVGGPTQNAWLRNNISRDLRAIGGVMNGRADPRLRVDVTQHQMHAVILARRFIYRAAD
jgi:hypothetical protein